MLDLILAPTCLGCGRLLVQPRVPEVCSRCRPDVVELEQPTVGQPPITAGYEYEGPLVEALRRLKYRGGFGDAGPLGRALAPLLAEQLDADGWDVVACVPTFWRRRAWRGYDHVALVLAHAWRRVPRGSRENSTLAPGLLARLRSTAPQVDLPARERIAAPRNTVAVSRPRLVAGRRVLVVDDVTTTGATLRACFDALHEAGARGVGGLALLRAGK